MNFSNNSISEKWTSMRLLIANIVLDVIIFVVAVLGNLLVIFTIAHEKKLQTTCNFLLLHLAISDINLVVFNIPFDIYTIIHGSEWTFGEVMCRLLYPTNTVFYISGALILTLISLDRYRVFVQTFKAKLRRAQAKKLIAFIYMLAVLSVLPYILNLKLRNGECVENWSLFLYRQLYTVFLFLIQYAIPLVIMIVMYTSIGRHLRRKTQRVSISGNRQYAKVSLCSSTTTKTRFDRLREERNKKALKTVITVVVVFSVFMLPYQLIWIIADFRGMEEETLSSMSKLFVIFSYIGSCTLNPFIYGIGDRQFRKGYRSVLNHLVHIVTRDKVSRERSFSRDDTKSSYFSKSRDMKDSV